jgi:ketosteroid isomerase-like protein
MTERPGPGDPKDVVRRFFATLSSGDYDAIGKFFDDDSVWKVNDVPRGHPEQRGQAIITDFLRPVRDGLFEPGNPKVELTRLIAEGDWVVAQGTGRGRLRSGDDYANEYVYVLRVENGKVKFLHEYMDTAYAHSFPAPDTGDQTADTLRRLGH